MFARVKWGKDARVRVSIRRLPLVSNLMLYCNKVELVRKSMLGFATRIFHIW